MNTLVINGVGFETIIPRKEIKSFKGQFAKRNRIYEIYKQPSQAKINIWESWYDWAYETLEKDYLVKFDITKHNLMTFTIEGFYIDNSGCGWNLVITPTHNRAYKVASNYFS